MSLPYPYCLLNENIHPILGEDFNELPLYFEFTDRESDLVKLQNTKTQKEVCEYIFEELLEKSESKWSVCG
ncbi:MAG: hypothetical protein LBR30_04205, partial [Clostridioides sp.]|nr:hypothetical protein [Clostridioides sp.]